MGVAQDGWIDSTSVRKEEKEEKQLKQKQKDEA
jgi:hypothetical protein